MFTLKKHLGVSIVVEFAVETKMFAEVTCFLQG